MGKKKDKKKGKGAEKTAVKTEKKMAKKTKKMLAEKGEDDIESLIAEFAERDRQREKVHEEKVPPPSPRGNMSFTPHPDKDEIIMFGGEFFNGNKTFMYNDLLFYNVKTTEWTKVTAPDAPPPRCSHQAVALHQGGGQLWIFGGEFASPTQSQFYHYKDLWVFHLKDKQWNKIRAPGGPSARSGHRMAALKRQLIVFGGFHDNIRDYKYFNDVYAFNLDTLTWSQLQTVGNPPSPRSGCQLAVMPDTNGIMVYGGYSKERIKKDVDLGKTHIDMFVLSPDPKDDSRWKWTQKKQHGVRPTARSGFSLIPTPGNRALLFGGVHDDVEDEESVEGTFFNDMYQLRLDNGTWHELILKGKKDPSAKRKRRRKEKEVKEEGEQEESSEDEIEQLEELKMDEEKKDTPEQAPGAQSEDIFKVTVAPQAAVYDDGIFTVKMGGAEVDAGGGRTTCVIQEVFQPSCRMNAMLAVKNGILFLYGGLYEDGDRQITLSDLYSLDLYKLEEWKILIPNSEKSMEWVESDSSDDDDEDDEDGATLGKRKRAKDDVDPTSTSEDVDDDDDDDDDDDESEEGDSDEEEEEDSDEDMEQGAPAVKEGEEAAAYFERTQEYWLEHAQEVARKEGIEASGKKLKKAASKMAAEYVSSQRQ